MIIVVFADIQDQKNLDNSKRFTTLLDRTISINSMGGFGGDTTVAMLPVSKSFQYFKRMNMPVIYNDSATTGAIATINSNNLVLMYISEKGKCGVKGKLRVRYMD